MSTIYPEDSAPFRVCRIPLDQGELPELSSPGLPLYRDCLLPNPVSSRDRQPPANSKLFGFRYRRRAEPEERNKLLLVAGRYDPVTQTSVVPVGFQSAGTKSFEETWRDRDMTWDEYTDD